MRVIFLFFSPHQKKGIKILRVFICNQNYKIKTKTFLFNQYCEFKAIVRKHTKRFSTVARMYLKAVHIYFCDRFVLNTFVCLSFYLRQKYVKTYKRVKKKVYLRSENCWLFYRKRTKLIELLVYICSWEEDHHL